MAEAIGWPELIVLMALAEDGGGIRGTAVVHETWELEDGVPLTEVEEADAEERHPVFGRLAVRHHEYRVALRGDDHRLETPDGDPVRIGTEGTLWLFRRDGAVRYDLGNTSFAWAGTPEVLLHRPPLSRWDGNDFSRPTGPVTATEFLGRPAWAVELAPPAHKPYPLQLVVDAATGRLLSQANRDWGSVVEWTSVEFGLDLPDGLFRWDGPARSGDEVRAERRAAADAEWEAESRDRRAWLAEHGLGRLVVPVELELELHHHVVATGEFSATVLAPFDGALLRRPASDDPWDDADDMNWPHETRWRAGTWDWCLATEDELSPDQLAALRDQLDRAR